MVAEAVRREDAADEVLDLPAAAISALAVDRMLPACVQHRSHSIQTVSIFRVMEALPGLSVSHSIFVSIAVHMF